MLKPSAPKLVAILEQYAEAWSLLDERERLCFDLVMFAGMRESEAFAIWCGDVAEDGIHIERRFYKGSYGPPKTPKSDRIVGVPDEIMERLQSWISRLPVTIQRRAFFHHRSWSNRFGRKACWANTCAHGCGRQVSVGSILRCCAVTLPRCTNAGNQTPRSSPTSKVGESGAR